MSREASLLAANSGISGESPFLFFPGWRERERELRCFRWPRFHFPLLLNTEEMKERGSGEFSSSLIIRWKGRRGGGRNRPSEQEEENKGHLKGGKLGRAATVYPSPANNGGGGGGGHEIFMTMERSLSDHNREGEGRSSRAIMTRGQLR